MTIKEMRKSLGDTQTDFSRRYHIPFRTIQNWEAGVNSPPAYVEELLERQIKTDLINRRQFQVPKWSSDKSSSRETISIWNPWNGFEQFGRN